MYVIPTKEKLHQCVISFVFVISNGIRLFDDVVFGPTSARSKDRNQDMTSWFQAFVLTYGTGILRDNSRGLYKRLKRNPSIISRWYRAYSGTWNFATESYALRDKEGTFFLG
jgi:hypothetical protein